MSAVESIEKEIAAVTTQVKPLMRKLEKLRADLATAKSLEWIRVNNVNRSDVELLSDDKPYFANSFRWAIWLSENSRKRFCEWNGMIYHTAELVKGDFSGGIAFVSDLPK